MRVKAALLLALLCALVLAFAGYVLYARGTFESTQRLVLMAANSEGISVGADLSFYRGFSEDPASVVSCAALLPRVYFRFGEGLGAIVTPWVGVAAEMLLYGVDATEPTALAAFPALGVDINPVRSIAVYVEGGWRFADTLLKEGTDAWLARGPVLMAGMKLYFGL